MNQKRRQNERADIAIVGGGAAGLAAAIAAGETLRGSGAGRVVLCEASDRVGRSILATGNGRCNFSNARLTETVLRDAEVLGPLYRNADFVAEVFAALEELSLFSDNASERASSSESLNNVLRFFEHHGLVWREESEGRLYPLANKASSVLDVLRASVEAARVDIATEFALRDIVRQDDVGFLLKSDDGRELRAQRVIIATGGALDEGLAASLELPFVDQRPVLGPLAVDAMDKRTTKRLDNIRVKVCASLLRNGVEIRREQGEVLFRTYGLSGIAIFDLSRDALLGDEVSLDLLPQMAARDTLGFLDARADRAREQGMERPTYGDVLRGIVLPQVTEALCARARVKADDAYDALGAERLACAIHDLRFTVEGIGDARQCQVQRGGVSVAALDAATLEIAAAPGLHVVGEALDVDAACGGFNLHWAWASGLLAGHAAAQAVLDASKGSR